MSDPARDILASEAIRKELSASAPAPCSGATDADDWLDSWDRRWNGRILPFVFGLNVGVFLTTIWFVIAWTFEIGGK